MPGLRSMGARRERGSWLPRLAGIGVVLLLAAAGVIVALVTTKPAVTRHSPTLPTKVLAAQTVGLVVPGPPAPARGQSAPQMLLNSPGGLAFRPVPRSSLVTGNPEWTADRMAGGTYIFIYIPNGRCLAASGSPRHPALALQRCSLGSGQRWRQLDPAVELAGRSYSRFSNLATERCLSAGNPALAAGQRGLAARLVACDAALGWRQLISFWWAA